MILKKNIKEDKIKEKLFIRGIKSFNQKKFYKAHEYWEDLWIDYRLFDEKFIQALIQMAVGCFHITNINKKGAISLLTKSLDKFKLYEKKHRGIDVSMIIDSIVVMLLHLRKIENINDFNWSLVPKIRIIDEQ